MGDWSNMNLGTVLAAILFICAAGYLILGVHLLASRRETGTLPIGTIFLLVTPILAGGAVELFAVSEFVFNIGRTGHFLSTAFLPVAAYVCFREYTGARSPTWFLVLLLIIPFVSVAFAATNATHGLMWPVPAATDSGELLTRPAEWGPWFLYVHAPYSYAMVAIALLTLLVHSSAVPPVHRRSVVLLVAICTPPLIATIAYDLGMGSNTLSYVPLVFAAMLPFNTWIVLQKKIGDHVPLAYETVFQNMLDPVVVVDDQHRIIGINRGAESMLEMSETDALRVPLEEAFGERSTCVFEALSSGQPQRMLTESGRYLHVQASPIRPSGRSTRGGQVLMFRDVSDVENAQSEVRKSELLLRTLVDHSVNGVIRLRWDDDHRDGTRTLRCIFANAAAGRFLETGVERLQNRDADGVIRLAATGMADEEIASVLDQFAAAVTAGAGIDTELRQGNAPTVRWLRMIGEPVGDDIAVTFVDITDTKAKQRHMESIASSDPLTGVLNRRGFERNASERLSESADDASGALLFIDLNDFKKVNDEYGHGVGDQLLTIAAKRLQKSLRSCDIIGRPGGDEFVALVPDVSKYMAGKLAARLAVALEEPYVVGGLQVHCTASIGLAHYPDNANTLTGLLREADQAMYRAKARNREGSEFGKLTSRLEKAV
jgi:diguanylate cyclase (GGDEF)-like protein